MYTKMKLKRNMNQYLKGKNDLKKITVTIVIKYVENKFIKSHTTFDIRIRE